ncbi:MAG TPA: hypothetical protein VIS72_03150, partial [Anaerolineales bacterium]
SQVNAIDYQSHIAALFLAILSIGLTLKAVLSKTQVAKIAWIILSIFAGLAALSQMEYYIGIEVFRFSCIAVLMWRSGELRFMDKVRSIILKWIPFSLIPVTFMLWRIFLFETERRATDIGSQLGQLFSSPLTGLWWFTYLAQDFFNVLLAPWVIPFSMFVLPMRLQNQLMGFGLAALAAVLFIWSIRGKSETEPVSSPREMREQSIVGVLSILGGLGPVIAANRHVVLPDYSRYTLIASIGAVILLSAFIQQLSSARLRNSFAGMLIAISVLTHYGNSVKTASDTEVIQNFWWQVAWRVPQIENGTTLSVTYPDVAIQEDYFIWGAANHIYYPEPDTSNDLQVQLPALVLNDYTVSRILAERGEDSYRKRGGVLVINEYDKVLILTQADRDSCVRVLNGNSPDLSAYYQHRVMVVAPYSKLDTVIIKKDMPVPTKVIFGSEPLHEWCYYYQKADLARQQGSWDEVARLGDEAQSLELHPNDQIEWMPFLQAYAFLGNEKQVKELSTRINTVLFYSQQACRNLNAMPERGYPLTAEMQAYVDELFCQ